MEQLFLRYRAVHTTHTQQQSKIRTKEGGGGRKPRRQTMRPSTDGRTSGGIDFENLSILSCLGRRRRHRKLGRRRGEKRSRTKLISRIYDSHLTLFVLPSCVQVVCVCALHLPFCCACQTDYSSSSSSRLWRWLWLPPSPLPLSLVASVIGTNNHGGGGGGGGCVRHRAYTYTFMPERINGGRNYGGIWTHSTKCPKILASA